MTELDLIQKHFGTITINREMVLNNPAFMKESIAEEEKTERLLEEEHAARAKVREGHEQIAADLKRKIQEFHNNGFDDSDEKVLPLTASLKMWEGPDGLLTRPDTILGNIQSELDACRSRLDFWRKKLLRYEYLQREKKAEAKTQPNGKTGGKAGKVK
jgi:hypothetical protein